MSFNHRIGSFARIPSDREYLLGHGWFDPYAPGNEGLNRELHPRKPPPSEAVVTFAPGVEDAIKARKEQDVGLPLGVTAVAQSELQ